MQPASEQHFLSAVWDSVEQAVTPGAERTRDLQVLAGSDVSPLFENWEVVAVQGPESFPCALVAHHATSDEVRVLAQQPACDDPYGGGISPDDLVGLTRRADIERVRDLNDTRARLMREAVESGLAEHDAVLRVIDQKTELGYYPRSPYLVARALEPQEVDAEQAAGRLSPLYVIEEMQFSVGLFQDLERAIDAPGTEVDKAIGAYVHHDRYTTSQELNRFLQEGGSTFYVGRGGGVFEIRLMRP